MAEACGVATPLKGAAEVDQSYFGAHCIRDKRGRDAYGKTIVFGLLKQQGNMYAKIMPDCSKATMQDIIKGHADSTTIIHSDGWRG